MSTQPAPAPADRVPTERSEAGVSRPHADKGPGFDTFPRTSETLDQRLDADHPSITATVSLDAIAHNVRVLREHANGARVMPVVKANGYGHGATAVARAALAAGADEIGVATIDEALELRAAGIDAPVLAWLHSSAAQFTAAAAADIALGISSIEQAQAVRAIARTASHTASRPIRVDLKVDTGLSRGGAPASEWPRIMDELAAAEVETQGALRMRGVFSHLACADEPGHPSIDAQAALFREAIALAHARGLTPTVNHLSNSAATLTRPDLAFDLVRPGLATYGLSPVPTLGDFVLHAALGLTARLSLVKRVDAGAGVSYGHNWTSTRATTLGLVPMGYADGIPRALSGRFGVRARGVDYPAVGRICMDQFVVDLGANPAGLRAGDEVTLIGSEPGDATLENWAETLDTISYELATLLRGRTHLRYV